ncbi:MAG: phage terminase small subunit [Eubacterium sp.]|nr:phage terminase small subunit [Eubacterium sp.]
MARKRNPARDKAKSEWLKSGGKISTKQLAATYDVSEVQIRKWKSADKWQAEFERKKRGGQKGNKNAEGHGAPKGNKNAETHGAYSTVHLDGLKPEERAYIESTTLDAGENMLRELQLLLAKERDLTRRISEYEQADPAALYTDRVVEVYTPKAGGDSGEMSLKQNAKTVVKTSPFERMMKLEAEYNKIHGRIIKLIDSIRAYEVDNKRLNLDERKHELSKQRLTGEYSVDPDTGEISDEPSAEDNDIDL